MVGDGGFRVLVLTAAAGRPTSAKSGLTDAVRCWDAKASAYGVSLRAPCQVWLAPGTSRTTAS